MEEGYGGFCGARGGLRANVRVTGALCQERREHGVLRVGYVSLEREGQWEVRGGEPERRAGTRRR